MIDELMDAVDEIVPKQKDSWLGREDLPNAAKLLLMREQIKDCLINGVHFLSGRACLKRQVATKYRYLFRYPPYGMLHPQFAVCVKCRHFLSDENYNKIQKFVALCGYVGGFAFAHKSPENCSGKRSKVGAYVP